MIKCFKERVAEFWQNFIVMEAELREIMDQRVNGQVLIDQLGEQLHAVFAEAYFEAGRGKDGKYELTMTPEGDLAKLLRLNYWRNQAPEVLLARWRFYDARPGLANADDLAIGMFDVQLSGADVSIGVDVNQTHQQLDLSIYCPKIAHLKQSEQFQMLFILLDTYLGEKSTMHDLGDIDISEAPPKGETMLPGALKAYLAQVADREGWDRPENLCNNYTLYEMKPNTAADWDLREDVYIGNSACLPLVRSFHENDSRIFEEASADGVVFGYLYFPNATLPQKEKVVIRGKIEDKLNALTVGAGIAECIGGATGHYYSYMDFIVYDPAAFLPLAGQVLAAYNFSECAFSEFRRTEKVYSLKEMKR